MRQLELMLNKTSIVSEKEIIVTERGRALLAGCKRLFVFATRRLLCVLTTLEALPENCCRCEREKKSSGQIARTNICSVFIIQDLGQPIASVRPTSSNDF